MLSKRLILIIVGGLIFLNVEGVKGKSQGYKVIGPVMGGGKKIVREKGDTLTIEKDPMTHVVKSVSGLKIDIKKKYGVSFSQLDRMSEKKIDQLAKRFLRDYQEFIEVDLNELFLTKVHKDSAFRWSHTDSARWWKAYGISYSQVHRGVKVHFSRLGFHIRQNGIKSFGMRIHPNVNISTTPSISKTQAVELAKKHLRENAKELELPDTTRDYLQFGGYKIKQAKVSKLEALEMVKTQTRYQLEALEMLEKKSKVLNEKEKIFKEHYALLQSVDTNRVYLTKYNEHEVPLYKIKILKSVTPVNLGLKDSTELFILPKIEKDSTVNYYLAYHFRLVTSPYIGRKWVYWIDAQSGEIIEAYKQWSEYGNKNVELNSIVINDGPTEVGENSSTSYNCYAIYYNSETGEFTQENITTSASWTDNSNYATISNGKLTTLGVHLMNHVV